MWDKSSLSRNVFDYITDSRVEWTKLDEAYDIAIIHGKTYPIRAGAENFKSDLIAWFPNSEEAINDYFEALTVTGNKMSKYVQDQIASGWLPRTWITFDADFGVEVMDSLGVIETKSTHRRLTKPSLEST